MDMMAIAALITGLRESKELASAAINLTNDTKVIDKLNGLVRQVSEAQASLLDVQASLLAAQSSLAVQMQEKHDLERKVRELQAEVERSETFSRYALVEPYPGTHLYRLKADSALDGEPIHDICPVCKDSGLIGIVEDPGKSGTYARCKRCDRTYQIRDQPPFNRRNRTDF